MSTSLRHGALVAVMLSGAIATVAAQTRDQREATVGMRCYVEQKVLPGTELAAAPGDFRALVAVRVVKIWPHGSQLRYDLEWTGFEPGTYDLCKFLVRKDGSSTDDLPALAVTVTSVRDGDDNEPSEPEPVPAPRVDGYGTDQIVFAVVWVVGLLGILFFGRQRKAKAAPPAPRPTLADRLRPLVERVAGGDADDAAKAELERLLVAFWRARLGLGEAKAGDAIAAIRRHDEAGVLLRQVEAWLHMPVPPQQVDLKTLLEPYRAVTADSFAPLAKDGTKGATGGAR
ncbi:MAG: hypothetical protein H6835_16165 [Planctomycetes bacterium]|nr:hypothetical protein [Planctomycetota bacterium]